MTYSVPFTIRRALEKLHQEGCSFGGVPTATMIIETIHRAGGKIIVDLTPYREAMIEAVLAVHRGNSERALPHPLDDERRAMIAEWTETYRPYAVADVDGIIAALGDGEIGRESKK